MARSIFLTMTRPKQVPVVFDVKKGLIKFCWSVSEILLPLSLTLLSTWSYDCRALMNICQIFAGKKSIVFRSGVVPAILVLP
jgi:hypothetical protein